ncbi:MAG: hypothetical protein WAW02_09435 [Sideroxyarcus sp.]
MLNILAVSISIEGPEIQITMHQESDSADIPNKQRRQRKTRLQQQERHEKENQELPKNPLSRLGNNMVQLAGTNIQSLYPGNGNCHGRG